MWCWCSPGDFLRKPFHEIILIVVGMNSCVPPVSSRMGVTPFRADYHAGLTWMRPDDLDSAAATGSIQPRTRRNWGFAYAGSFH